MAALQPSPKTLAEWEDEAQKVNLQNTSLKGLPSHQSGSKSRLDFRNDAPTLLGVKLVQARQQLAASRDFQYLLLALQNSANVNAVHINFLQAIYSIVPTPIAEWRHTKIRLTAHYGVVNKKPRKMVAVTDGQLQALQSKEIMALIECKKAPRSSTNAKVEMQEAALFLAWVKEYSGYTGRRSLVSQNYMNLYITFADIPDDWLTYVTRHHKTPISPMALYRYGPSISRTLSKSERQQRLS
ncbi:hypothetical protein BDV19DRAFT_394223 [Aspergillus venezuelensis]